MKGYSSGSMRWGCRTAGLFPDNTAFSLGNRADVLRNFTLLISKKTNISRDLEVTVKMI